MTDETIRRILLIDDTPSIHEDFRKILGVEDGDVGAALGDARAGFFGDQERATPGQETFEVDSAFQGQEGLEMLLAAARDRQPYALAFVDVRMPPGWDGIQTIKQLWKADPHLQIVICTAYSDYSWNQTVEELEHTDRFLILKKPFDSIEVRQLASALTEKWIICRRERALIESLEKAEAEARSYASSLETMNRALTTANATAERASKMKSEFLVHLSAQVNMKLTPLLERVARLDRSEELEGILDASRHLIRTLDRILDMTHLQACDMQLDPVSVSIAELAREAVEEVRPEAEDKGLSLSLVFSGQIPELVECDPRRVRQILAQLLDNAVRWTTEGEIEVKIGIGSADDWRHSRLTIAVRDTGCGVPQELEGRLFEPFASHGPDSTAAGLGLALARRLALLMDGDVTHQGAPQGGSLFTITLEVANVPGTVPGKFYPLSRHSRESG